MYSVVLMTVLSAGGAESTSFGRHHGCHSCHSCHSCHGYAFSCHGCSGCWGCHGCWGSSCYSCYSSCYSCYSSCYICYSSCCSCYSSCCSGCWGCSSVGYYYSCSCSGCFGCHGCCGGSVYNAPSYGATVYNTPVVTSPPVAAAPTVRVTTDPTTAPQTTEEADAVRRTLKDLRDKGAFVPPPPVKETSAAPARLTVQLPADAKLWVDSTVCPLTTGTRSFNTPNLEPGRQYFYTLRMEVERDGQTLQMSRRVFVGAGQAVRVDLNNLNTATVRR